ncbi:MAG: GTPase Era [Rhizobiales bacterium]|nr:GTPase Era [Hyphomicrobiales bacterium]
MSEAKTRAGFVALIGAPNAGKSTLINQLVGAKVSIVSRKVQTTRAQSRGIAIVGDSQIVFVDTPGLFKPKRRLDRAMVTSAWGGAGEADVVCLLIDARKGLDEEAREIVARLGELRAPTFLILNKVDVIDREKLLALAQEANGLHAFAHTFMISALTGDGVETLTKALAAEMPASPWLYPEDQLTDGNLRMLAAEITREKLFERLHEELPYQLTVETEQWKEQQDGSVRVEQTIYVTREGHKKIVIGDGGHVLKTVGSMARKDIAAEAGQKIHLFLFVKVRENWLDDPERYREMGLDFPKE